MNMNRKQFCRHLESDFSKLTFFTMSADEILYPQFRRHFLFLKKKYRNKRKRFSESHETFIILSERPKWIRLRLARSKRNRKFVPTPLDLLSSQMIPSAYPTFRIFVYLHILFDYRIIYEDEVADLRNLRLFTEEKKNIHRNAETKTTSIMAIKHLTCTLPSRQS